MLSRNYSLSLIFLPNFFVLYHSKEQNLMRVSDLLAYSIYNHVQDFIQRIFGQAQRSQPSGYRHNRPPRARGTQLWWVYLQVNVYLADGFRWWIAACNLQIYCSRSLYIICCALLLVYSLSCYFLITKFKDSFFILGVQCCILEVEKKMSQGRKLHSGGRVHNLC